MLAWPAPAGEGGDQKGVGRKPAAFAAKRRRTGRGGDVRSVLPLAHVAPKHGTHGRACYVSRPDCWTMCGSDDECAGGPPSTARRGEWRCPPQCRAREAAGPCRIRAGRPWRRAVRADRRHLLGRSSRGPRTSNCRTQEIRGALLTHSGDTHLCCRTGPGALAAAVRRRPWTFERGGCSMMEWRLNRKRQGRYERRVGTTDRKCDTRGAPPGASRKAAVPPELLEGQFHAMQPWDMRHFLQPPHCVTTVQLTQR